jgi:hypothetical protein
VRLAYLIMAYKLPQQVVRLVRTLADDGVTFFVHVDRKTHKNVYDEIVTGLREVPRVEWLTRRRCYWSGFGVVAAMLEAIKRISLDPEGFDYAMLLTADSYPLRSNREIKDYLRRLEGRSCIEHAPLPAAGLAGGGLDRIERWHWPVKVFGRRLSFPNRYLNLPIKRRFPAGYQPFAGSAGWCLSGACVAHVAAFTAANPRLVQFFKRVFAPDESLFQTILLNSPFAEKLVNDDLWYVDWSGPFPPPRILTTAEFDALMASADLFARKFDITRDAEILDLIDEAIARRESSSDPLQVPLRMAGNAVQLEIPPDGEP